mmetsp:Transcript_13677/g.39864  ORF Transcript_13677/g.39864 Transcript_13677/m.39864 type:complete len:972 (+) Transcript_13677:216-3131(+)
MAQNAQFLDQYKNKDVRDTELSGRRVSQTPTGPETSGPPAVLAKKRSSFSLMTEMDGEQVSSEDRSSHERIRNSLHKSMGSFSEGDQPVEKEEELPHADAVLDESLMDTGEEGLTTEVAQQRLDRFGRNELTEKVIPKWQKFIKCFRGPMPYMIWVAIIIEGIIQDWPNFVVLFILQMVNGCLAFNEANKAGNAISALKASLKPEAQVKRSGVWKNMDAALLVPGDRIALAAGASVPADARICPGQPIDIDQAALTGESLPVTFYEGNVAKMGSNVIHGEVEAIVSATGVNTFFGKTAALIQSVKEIPHFQKVLLTIMKTMVSISLVVVSICLIFLLVQKEPFLKALAFSVVLVIASIPIALPVVSTTTMAVGSKRLADQKAIVAQLASIEQLAGMNMLCSDKTGTLTLNKMVLEDYTGYAPDITKEKVLQYAALAAKWKEPAKDALDTLVLNAVDKGPLDAFAQLEYTPFSPLKKRTEATLRGPDGRVFEVVKGAPHIVLEMCDKNKASIGAAFNKEVDDLAHRGIRALAVAVKYEGDSMEMVGLLTFLDPPRPDTKDTIARAFQYGCDVKMITGDHQAIAKETCRLLKMGTEILKSDKLPVLNPQEGMPKTLGRDYGELIEQCHGFAEVFPEHKFLIIEALRQRGWVVGMTGDGVNDAPALKRADVGIAVEGATDTARAAADIVLTAPGLSVMVDAIIVARGIFQRIKNYLVYRVAVTFQLLMFFFLSLLAFKPKDYGFEANDIKGTDEVPDFFQIPVIGLVIIVILNDFAIISIAYDHVIPSSIPEKWNLIVVFTVAIWLGMVAVTAQMTLLDLALDGKIFPGMSYGQIQMMIWLTVSLLDFFSVFTARVANGFFFERALGRPLLCAAIFALAISTVLSIVWPFNSVGGETKEPKMEPLFGKHIGFVWGYCIGWALVQDCTKVILYKILMHFDLQNIRTDMEENTKRAAIIQEFISREKRESLKQEGV